MSVAIRSTAEAQRERITAHAVLVFARGGYFATPVADVAASAGVSPAYVFRLFPGKLGLFVAAVSRCYEEIAAAMGAAADTAQSADPDARLAAASAAYVRLLSADRDKILIQVHAQSACSVPEIRTAVRAGLRDVVDTVQATTGADPLAVQRFVAYGLLCHLIEQAGLAGVDEPYAITLSAGITHPDDRTHR